MSLSKVTSSKSRDLHDHGVSSFERATLIFKEIEAFIDNELADTPIISASYEIPRMKSKRKRGPFLIKPLNKSKARKSYAIFSLAPFNAALNDMEYDPVRMEWAGNIGALKTFAGVRPALIANKANSYRPPTDEMIWNAKEQRWEGNWDDLRSFETRKPHLIKSIPSVALPKDRDGMSYNPITMTWDGNSDVLLAFGPISLESSTPDDGFKVGVEFQLTPATVQLFADCAARHNTNTNGWWRDEKTREHLAVIRTMSIMRLVRDVKRAAFAFEEPSYMDIASEREPPLKLKSPHAEPEVDFDDAWEDIGPFTGTVRVKLPESNTSDIDFGLEELSKFGSISNRNSKQAVADEDWDGDFAEDLSKILPRKLSTHKPIPSFTPPSNNSNNDLLITTPPLNPSISTIPVQNNSNSNPISLSSSTSSTSSSSSTNGKVTQLGKGSITEKKPFALLKADAPHRKSYHDLSAARASPKVAWDEDEEDGFEISNNAPLRLKVPGSGGVLSSSSSTVASEDEVDSDFDDDSVPSEPYFPEDDEGEVVEVEDDDWNDVELPPTLSLGESVTKRGAVQQLQQQQQYQPPEKEEWDEFEISAEKLELKLNQRKQQQQQNQQHQQHKKHHKGKAEEEELDGLDIPDGFQLRLKR